MSSPSGGGGAKAVSARDEDPYRSRIGHVGTRVPRREPVTYSEWRPGAPLVPRDLQTYARQGFLVLDDLFTAPEVTALRRELARLHEEAATSLDPDTIVREPGGEAIRSVFQIHRQSDRFHRLACDERLLRVAEFLLGDRVYVHQSRLNYKPGLTGQEFYWHSDFETWHTEDGMPRMRAISVSLLLARNTEHNGPLLLIPGSHRTYVGCVGETPEDHYRSSLRRQDVGVPDGAALEELAADGGIRSVTGPPGTVVFFDCNTMHGSNGNITPLPRSNAFIVYNAWSNRLREPFAGTAPRPEIIASRTATEPLRAASGPLAPRGGR